MPPDLALLSTLNGSNYPCLELIFMVPKVFEPLKFDCTYEKKNKVDRLRWYGPQSIRYVFLTIFIACSLFDGLLNYRKQFLLSIVHHYRKS